MRILSSPAARRVNVIAAMRESGIGGSLATMWEMRRTSVLVLPGARAGVDHDVAFPLDDAGFAALL